MRLLQAILMGCLLLACKQASKPHSAVVQDSVADNSWVAKTDSIWFSAAAAMAPDSLSMTSQFLILSGDTIAWPWPAFQNHEVVFADTTHSIKVRPIGRTGLALTLNYKEPGGSLVTEKATLQLHPAFYLAAEIANDPRSGDALPMVQYEATVGEKTYKVLLSVNEAEPRYAMCSVLIAGGGAPALQTKLLSTTKP